MEDFEVYEEHNEEDVKQNSFNEKSENTEMNMDDAAAGAPLQKEKKPSFMKRHKNACIISGCLLISIGGGFGGATLAYRMETEPCFIRQLRKRILPKAIQQTRPVCQSRISRMRPWKALWR